MVPKPESHVKVTGCWYWNGFRDGILAVSRKCRGGAWGVLKRLVFGTYPSAAKAGVAMVLPKRAASALTAAEPDPRPHQARAQHCPCRNEVHEVDRSHGRDAGPDEPEGEEEEPQA